MSTLYITILTSLLCSFVSGCRQKADIIFLVDASGSVRPDNFKKELGFVASMLSNFQISPDRVQVGVITFDHNAYSHLYLNSSYDIHNMTEIINNIPYTSGGTSTGDALHFVLQHGFTEESGDRPDAKNVLLVLTDGMSVNPSRTADIAYQFKEKHIKVISIGIGAGTYKQELLDMASVPGYVYEVTDFSKLGAILGRVETLICNNDVITTPSLQWFVGR